MQAPQHIDDALRKLEGDTNAEQNEDLLDITTDAADDASATLGADTQTDITMGSSTHGHRDEGMDEDNSRESDVIGPHQPFMPLPIPTPNSMQHQQRLRRPGRFATVPVVSEYTDPGREVFGLDGWNDHDGQGMNGDKELGSETAMTPTKHAVDVDERSLASPRSDGGDEKGTTHENGKVQLLGEYHSTLELNQDEQEDGRMGLRCERNQYQSRRPLSRKQSYPPRQLHSPEADADACGARTSTSQPSQGFVVVDMTKNEIITDPFLPSSPSSSYTCTATVATPPPPLPVSKPGNAAATIWGRDSTETSLRLAQALRRYGVSGGDQDSQPLQRFSPPVYLWSRVSTASHRSSLPTARGQLVTEPSYNLRTDDQQDARSLLQSFTNGCSKGWKRARQTLCGFEEVEQEELTAVYCNNPSFNLEQDIHNGGDMCCAYGILQNARVDISHRAIVSSGQLAGQAPSMASRNSESILTSPTTVVPSIVNPDHDLDPHVQSHNDNHSSSNGDSSIQGPHQCQHSSHNISSSCAPYS